MRQLMCQLKAMHSDSVCKCFHDKQQFFYAPNEYGLYLTFLKISRELLQTTSSGFPQGDLNRSDLV